MNLKSASGLRAAFNANGSLRRMEYGGVTLNLFVGSEVEGGPANVWLRRRGERGVETAPLLGPRSATRFQKTSDRALRGEGAFGSLRYALDFILAADAPAWFWRVSIANEGEPLEFDLLHTQDVALAPYGAIRLNEYYVSQYIDHTPLTHAKHGTLIASRQNQAASGRYPWCIIGSLRHATSFATDAMQVYGLSLRGGGPALPAHELPGRRLQHEHSMACLQDAAIRLAPGDVVSAGFCGLICADHPAATSPADLEHFETALAQPEAHPAERPPVRAVSSAASLFTHAATLAAEDLHEPDFVSLFGAQRRHEERDEQDRLLSFFHGHDRHVVLRAKELRVQRPHGCMLRTGEHLTPDESALTSTVWMGGVFHSMVTQGHVSINRFLSTVHSYIGLYRAHGQRVFAEIDGAWRLLDTPSAFEMAPNECTWIYRHAGGEIVVRSEAHSDPQQLSLSLEVRSGRPTRFLISHHVALNGDDGASDGAVVWRREGAGVAVSAAEGSEVQARFPRGSFLIAPAADTKFERVGGDELLFLDGRSREQPFLCIITAAARSVELRLAGRLIADAAPGEHASRLMRALAIEPPSTSAHAREVRQLRDITPWFVHNALVHYLAPRGLEQYSGGGWGVRDVCQGPVELLLAFGRNAPVRDLLLRVMRAQNPDGDWPQWFMFFERERAIRAGDSHGDVVFWPLLALGQYLLASGDRGVLDAAEPFYAPPGGHGELATVWEHVERALGLIERRRVAGTALAAYWHGDWNDSLQPADPSMRESMCSAWTATLHYQTLTTLGRALRSIGRETDAAKLESQASEVRRDFQRLLLVDDVLVGYARFEKEGMRCLLHPRDSLSGVHYSSLAMIHAILEDLLSPEQARAHLRLIEERLCGPDGLRLFDRPMHYNGGTQRLFQRAETATFFGREIGLMYMHAHLRYAQALARVGEPERFFRALCQANPIGLSDRVPQATLRQANCYYSSSDAAFADRYEASAAYDRVHTGEIPLDGGWRVYSSGAGIATSLIVRRLLGLNQERDALVVDPVMPSSLSGLAASVDLYGRAVNVKYDVGPAGCGVGAVEVNGRLASVEYEPNPYRRGAARVRRDALESALAQGVNSMRISVG